MESDLDFAFHLQLQEALNASVCGQPSTSTASPVRLPDLEQSSSIGDAFNFTAAQSQEILKFQQELDDKRISETEFKKIQDDLYRRIHDQRFALEISQMPDDEWENYGDDFELPFGEGSSKSVSTEVFNIYFKGVGEERAQRLVYGGIGVAICDSSDQLLFELSKPFVGNGENRNCMELKALIEGLNAAIALDLKSVVFHCDVRCIYNFVTGQWTPKQRKVAALRNQVNLLRERFTLCRPVLVPRNEIKFVFKFAREALNSQIMKQQGSSTSKNVYESCVICLEEVEISHIFIVDGCLHRYCISCMKQHMEVKLLSGVLPKCPQDRCNSELRTDSCCKILTPKLIPLLNLRIKEASIPVGERVYCPFPKCSALMSRREVLEYSRGTNINVDTSGARVCTQCNGQFCINCKVTWHCGMNCYEYRRRNPGTQEDVKLKSLAALNLWRQCVKCSHMIELAAGCYHMTCRCGYEFCYTCGAEWRNKKQTCSCPLWNEDNLIEADDNDDDFDEDSDSDFDEYYF
ncbi:unnamed protein product [Cuscuta epithymum]|uniref:RBR-type E3 ubiquitin transferase n=1 Tax=Cuscuta epithymum TaxID=186058 RepID=A0AAV0DQK2_9ASTE|nr:unnamed protein product [Cuscuta epithymum]